MLTVDCFVETGGAAASGDVLVTCENALDKSNTCHCHGMGREAGRLPDDQGVWISWLGPGATAAFLQMLDATAAAVRTGR